jgi:hypothetical protein
MFFTVFGGAWLALWAHFAWTDPDVVYAIVAALAAALFAYVYRVYAANRPALLDLAGTAEEKRRSRLFHFINAGQWVVILVAGNVLANTGHGDLVVPAAMFVIGAHFIPLARLFRYAPHYLTGTALMAVAVMCPFVHPASDVGPIGYAAAGAILWASAARAVSRTRA